MATTSTRKTTITFTGDVESTLEFDAASNSQATGSTDVVTLASGANTITVPSVSGYVPKAMTIVPPSGNTVLMTLKGVTGDTGVPLHKTDPTTVGIDTTVVTFCLTAAGTLAGVRLIWS